MDIEVFLGGLRTWAGRGPGCLGSLESALLHAGEFSWGGSREGDHAQGSPLI